MKQAQHGDTVSIHYTGKLEDQTVFDSTLQSNPLTFKIGEGQIISGLEEAVIGMSEGESKSIAINLEKAFGLCDDQLIQQVNRTNLPPNLDVSVGTRLNKKDDQGNTIPVVVTAVNDTSITIDANHPLAGFNLMFDIIIDEIS